MYWTLKKTYLPNLTAFLGIYLYLKPKNNDDSVKHVWKVLLNLLLSKEPIKEQFFWIFECSSQNSLSFSCQFWNDKSIPLQIFAFFIVMTHNSSANFKAIHFLLWTKGSHQSPNFDTLKCSGENLPNFSSLFSNHKSVFHQILDISSVSWKITPL